MRHISVDPGCTGEAVKTLLGVLLFVAAIVFLMTSCTTATVDPAIQLGAELNELQAAAPDPNADDGGLEAQMIEAAPEGCWDYWISDPKCYTDVNGNNRCNYILNNFYIVEFPPEDLGKYHDGQVVGNSCTGYTGP